MSPLSARRARVTYLTYTGLAAFLRRAPEPIFPPHIFANPIPAVAFVITLLVAAAMAAVAWTQADARTVGTGAV